MPNLGWKMLGLNSIAEAQVHFDCCSFTIIFQVWGIFSGSTCPRTSGTDQSIVEHKLHKENQDSSMAEWNCPCCGM